ncbi:hypothetical protein K488DRAFT_89094 [Vararia minispora EC-137]|uniref:Uncharacterized protein n=1 Tax=Vararia minispora EC-137 TaxID=1314806 RepID=A0ACB8QBU2_9AGAM|nr:hypothetical protein K488DRAFT_89094 [Vararia minispora EC-137]
MSPPLHYLQVRPQKPTITYDSNNDAELEVSKTRALRQESSLLVSPGTAIEPQPGSSVNWWPYPSWSGAAGFGSPTLSASTASPIVSPPDIQNPQTLPAIITASRSLPSTSLGAMSPPAPLPSGVAPSDLVLSTAVPSLTSSPILPTSMPVSSSASVTGRASSSVGTASRISISALPPASSDTTVQTYALSSPARFKIIYLTPLFVLVGLALGALTSILLFRWYRRRSSPYGNLPLQPGPPYEPPEAEYSPVFNDAVRVDLPTDGLEKQTAHPTPERSSSRTPSRRPTMSTTHSTRSPRRSNTASSQPFLSLPTLGDRSDSPSVYSEGAQTRSSSRATFITAGRQTPFDGLYEGHRNKSFRRGLVKRIASDSKEARGHSQIQASDPELGASVHHEHSQGQDDNESHTPLLDVYPNLSGDISGPGFCIAEEDPIIPKSRCPSVHTSRSICTSGDKIDAQSNGEPTSVWLAWTRSWSATSLGHPTPSDRYTPAPARRTPAKREASTHRNTPSPTPPHKHPHANLPASPPLIRSPQLDAALTFGMTGHVDRLVPSAPSAPEPLRFDKTRRKARTLHATNPPSLPYPSTSEDSPYRARLTKSPPARPRGGRSVERGRSDASEDMLRPSKRAIPPAERHALREGAVERVEDIVVRGYAVRGLMAVEDEVDYRGGIEQRLGT